MSQDLGPEDIGVIDVALREMGLLRDGARMAVTALHGGVSCDVWRVDLESGPICVKRALPRLRVEAEWLAPAERAATEADWMRLIGAMNPRWTPRILGEDRLRHLFAMEYLPPATHPLWKANLAAGEIDAAFAAEVGSVLGAIHAATAKQSTMAARFSNAAQFHALRVEPYLLYTASRHPDLAPQIRRMAADIENARLALMHGDVSPKNILCGPAGPVFLDAETACYGDPAFDLAFCLNHLLLKCVWHPQWTRAHVESFNALTEAWLARVDWELPATAEARAACLLPVLLLARIDGKSPVEYLTGPRDKEFVRIHARRLMDREQRDLAKLASSWAQNLAAAGYR